MADIDAVKKSLAERGHFGDAENVAFDGFEVRALAKDTAAELTAPVPETNVVAAVTEATGAAPTDGPDGKKKK